MEELDPKNLPRNSGKIIFCCVAGGVLEDMVFFFCLTWIYGEIWDRRLDAVEKSARRIFIIRIFSCYIGNHSPWALFLWNPVDSLFSTRESKIQKKACLCLQEQLITGLAEQPVVAAEPWPHWAGRCQGKYPSHWFCQLDL